MDTITLLMKAISLSDTWGQMKERSSIYRNQQWGMWVALLRSTFLKFAVKRLAVTRDSGESTAMLSVCLIELGRQGMAEVSQDIFLKTLM
jgi:hypothetical protein